MKKKIIVALIAVLLIAVLAVTFAACSKKKGSDATETAKERDLSNVAVYSMDLSSIDGYADKSVTNGTWAQTYDKLIEYIKKETNTEKRFALMHKAEDLLMDTGCIVPLYYYTDLYMAKSNITGFYSSPLGYKFFKNTAVGGSNTNINIVLASEPQSIDPALNSAVDGATIISHCFSGLYRWDKVGNSVVLTPDCATGYTKQALEGGKVEYTFTLRENLKWSDGTALKASDFKKAWDRAVDPETAADYGYMFEVIDGYADGQLNVTANDTARTLKVVLTVDVAYFIELCAFPTYFPVPAVAYTDSTWATKVDTYIGNGAYKLSSWNHDTKMEFVKNDQYWDAATVTMNKITNYLSDNTTAMLTGYKAGTYDFIDDVPTDEIENLKTSTEYANQFHVEGQLGTYYVIFNNDMDILPSSYTNGKTDAEIATALKDVRKALSLLIDRNYIVEEIGQAGQVPAASFVAMGLTDADGVTEFYKNANKTATSYGYYSVEDTPAAFAANVQSAITTLKKYYAYTEENGQVKFTNVPKMTYLYNTSEGHKAIGEYIQARFKLFGIDMTLQNQEWNTFLETRKKGDYTIARNGWLGDYNDPISFLDMWTTGSGNNDAQFGK